MESQQAWSGGGGTSSMTSALSVHVNLTPAANSRMHIFGKPVGARKNAKSKDLRYRWFRARSRSLPSLGAFGGMVLIRQERKNGSNRGIFFIFQFCGTMTCAHVKLCRRPFGTWLCQARSQGLQSSVSFGPIVSARRARQNGLNRDFVAKTLPSLQ
jgi:hypothetical protein